MVHHPKYCFLYLQEPSSLPYCIFQLWSQQVGPCHLLDCRLIRCHHFPQPSLFLSSSGYSKIKCLLIFQYGTLLSVPVSHAMARLSALHGVIPSVIYPIVMGTDAGPDMLCSQCSEYSWKYTLIVEYFFQMFLLYECLSCLVCVCMCTSVGTTQRVGFLIWPSVFWELNLGL